VGQGASEALPVWAVYMQKAYANKAINISQGDFEKPDKPLTIELDCDKYKRITIQVLKCSISRSPKAII